MVTDHAPLQFSFKQWDLNKNQTRWLQELVYTHILIVYWPGKQAAVLNRLSHIPILHESMDESADSQPPAIF